MANVYLTPPADIKRINKLDRLLRRAHRAQDRFSNLDGACPLKVNLHIHEKARKHADLCWKAWNSAFDEGGPRG